MNMPEEPVTTSILRPQELKAVYAISNAVSEVADVDDALDRIIKLARPVLIFDNIVVYTMGEGQQIEPSYARIIGRGRSAEDDLSWGETIANEVVHTAKKAIQQERLSNWETNRLHLRYMLGLPLRSRQELIGTLVFGRFGGPPYTSDQIHLAEFVAIHIAQLLVRQQLVAQVAHLEAERRLRQLQDNFIATVSHELVTPLGFIKGYATTLLREDTSWDDGTRREFLEIIDEETDRLRALIDNLLDSSRLQAGTMVMKNKLIRLDMLLREIVMRSSARYENLQILLNPVEEVHMEVDPIRLTQVFDNLISNAVKYAPGSPINLSIQVSETPNGQVCRILIRDRGPGIPPEHVERLFERFYRVPDTSSKVSGTGLGLYICREIIRVHGGTIDVKSMPGKGTAFQILLPVKRQKVERTNAGG
jgi:signal transduction histidine kinase